MRWVLGTAFAAAALSIVSWTNPAAAAAVKPLFASEDLLHLTLRAPVDRMSRDADAKPMPGLLTVKEAASESLPVELSARGITRRRKDICPFPEIRVAFTGKPGSASVFRGQKSLKLVTHCKPAENFQQFVLLEYSAYLMYNLLTPESFKVRLASIDYVDDKGRAITSRLGYFVEDVDDVASRNDQKRLRGVNKVSVRQIDPTAGARFAMFEYMIGNLDWAMNAATPGDDCCHNGRLVGAKKGATADLIPVPYDFDFSGMVNAPYAVPPPIVKVASVRVRRYRGFCAHNAEGQAVAADFLAHRAPIIAVLDRIPQLDRGPRQRAADYLGEFFDHIGSPAEVAAIMKTCLG